ncbi:YtpI family protein [Bacillus sp. 165]|uniref:YtpI family protein n=1 Tax=Bacillus sp. 165 TaxID=1529117 RepID=UPI001AD959AC|nr:YtpI family protein [Bacillus sp. 165]MBO9130626.1 YtpI family protein [Bacillus sp. 165]
MLVLVSLILISLILYVFYKAKYFRTHRPMEKGWVAGKSSMALGAFIGFYGLNQLAAYSSSKVSLFVGIVFLLFGALHVYKGIRQYKHFLPLAVEEAENTK